MMISALWHAGRGGSPCGRRWRTACASLLRQTMRLPRPPRRCFWWSRTRPANSRGASVCPIGTHVRRRQTRYGESGIAALGPSGGLAAVAESTGDDQSAPHHRRITAPTISKRSPGLMPVNVCQWASTAMDQTFDRQLAYLGLLDGATSLFREGASVSACRMSAG